MTIARVCLCCVWLMLLGCGKNESAPLSPVRGQVWYQGRALSGGTVVFTPDTQRGGSGPMAWARIGPDGTFVLNTDGRHGATPGWHRVTIAPAGTDISLPARFRDAEQSEQFFEVKAERANVCELRLD